MKNFLYTLLALAFLSPFAVLYYQRCCLIDEIELVRKDIAEINRMYTSYDQIYKSVSMAELKLVSALKADRGMKVVNTADEQLSMIKVSKDKYAGDWVLVDLDTEEPTAFTAEIEDSTLTFFRKEEDGLLLIQKLVLDFHNVVPLTQFTDGVTKPFGDYAGALLPDFSYQSGQTVIPNHNAGYGIYNGNHDVIYLLTESFQECKFKLMREE